MPIDNDVYNREADGWRNEHSYLSLLLPATPPRVDYIRHVLADLQLDPVP